MIEWYASQRGYAMRGLTIWFALNIIGGACDDIEWNWP